MLWVALCIAGAVLAAYLVNRFVNRQTRLVTYTVRSGRLPAAFSGFRLLVAADLHDTPLCARILTLVEETKPDAVCMVGDMVYGGKTETMGEMCRILDSLAGVCPVYGVSGNHEACDTYDSFAEAFTAHGGVWLDDACVELRRGGDGIRIIGVKDRPFNEEETAASAAKLKENLDPDVYSVTLCHRPEVFPAIRDSGTDLVLAGHHHGGLIRLPFIGGVFAHRGKLFPDHDRGRYDEGGATLIVSAGCDDGSKLPRFNNPPEILLVTLERDGERDGNGKLQ